MEFRFWTRGGWCHQIVSIEADILLVTTSILKECETELRHWRSVAAGSRENHVSTQFSFNRSYSLKDILVIKNKLSIYIEGFSDYWLKLFASSRVEIEGTEGIQDRAQEPEDWQNTQDSNVSLVH